MATPDRLSCVLGFKQALQKVTGGVQPNQRRGAGGPPGRHARFGGVFVRRYNAEDKGAFVRNNALVSDLPEIPQLQKANKSMVCPFQCLLLNIPLSFGYCEGSWEQMRSHEAVL